MANLQIQIDRITLEALLYEEALDLYCRLINLKWEMPFDCRVARITSLARTRFERRFNQFTKGE